MRHNLDTKDKKTIVVNASSPNPVLINSLTLIMLKLVGFSSYACVASRSS